MNSNYNFVKASELRSNGTRIIPNNKNGYYIWWASNEFVDEIYDRLDIEEKNKFKDITQKKCGYYCVYFGIAPKKSLRSRINSHIKKKNNPMYNVSKSTLRKSLTALFKINKEDCDGTNKLIDKLFVEFFPIDLPFGTEETSKFLEDYETKFLLENFCVLNIDKHKHPYAVFTNYKITKMRNELLNR